MGAPATTPAMTRHVEVLWPKTEDLFVTGEQVSNLLAHPGWKAVQEIIDREKAIIDTKLDSPHRALEQAEYALAHGRRGGLTAAADAADAITAKAQQRYAEQNEDGAESPSER